MDYKELIERLKRRESDMYINHPMTAQACRESATAITDLLARAEAAEARAEKAERERDAAIKELDGVSSVVGDLADFIDEQIHPIVPYNMYTALMDNVYAITMWEKESEWRGQKEE